MKRPYLDDVLSDLKVAAFRNAVRLFKDACTLYVARAYPSAFALAVLSYEELGKTFYVDRVCGAISQNPGTEEEWYRHLVRSGLFRDHRGKQEFAYFDALGVANAVRGIPTPQIRWLT